MAKRLLNEIKSNLFVYILLFIAVVAGFYLRVYRIDKILGFYYDQGRDALVIWDLWHKGKLFLVGPTTGIAGIFRGPYYYWLIAPFYLLGQGNPIWPSVFLSVTTMLAAVMAYVLGSKINRVTGLFATLIASFSFNIVMASRWLSNPTPMLLLSMILVWGMLLVSEGKRWGWSVIAATAGLSLFNFGSAGEVFYFLALFIFIIWQRKNWPSKKQLIISCVLFTLTFLPLLLFDLKHDGILRNNIGKFLFSEKSFAAPTWHFVWDKLDFYYQVFTNKIFNGRYFQEQAIFYVIAAGFFFYLRDIWKNNLFKILILLFVSVCFGLVFFQGNFGNIYDYYLTGYYLIFILLFSITLGFIWKTKVGKLFVLYFFYLFFVNNYDVLKYKLSDGCNGPNSICLVNQLQAVDWIYTNAEKKPFNVDVYVPPVIPYAYDYLFLWRPTTPRFRGARSEQVNQLVPILYTLYEQDPPNPDRLEAWLARQKGIGKVEETARFGGITIERRIRIK